MFKSQRQKRKQKHECELLSLTNDNQYNQYFLFWHLDIYIEARASTCLEIITQCLHQFFFIMSQYFNKHIFMTWGNIS